MASHTPSTVLKVRAMAVKTKEFCTVWRKVSLARMSRKFLRPTKGPGEPMRLHANMNHMHLIDPSTNLVL